MDSRRAESFSDGVFAVAITVLVFNLLSIHGTTFHGLGRFWPQYAAYVISFMTIGIMWMNHHTMLAHIARVDRIMLILNMFLLLGVVAVPWPTALLAENLKLRNAYGSEVAAVLYGLVLIAISIGYGGMWQYLSTHQRKLAAIPIEPSLQVTLRFTAGLFGYIIATVVAALGAPDVALALYGVIAVYYLFEHLPAPVPDASDLDQRVADQPGGAGETEPPAG